MLLVLDACGVSSGLMEPVVAMAARLEAELQGLFVEDEALLRAAGLPFASEVAATGRERTLDPSSVESANRAASALAARLLHELATRRQVRWSFSTRAGLRVRSALDVAGDADVVLPPRSAATAAGSGPFRRVSFLDDDSAESARALSVIHALAANGDLREVLIVSRSARRHPVEGPLAALGVRVYAQHGAPDDVVALMRDMAAATRDGLVILPRRLLGVATPLHSAVVDALRSTLLLLR